MVNTPDTSLRGKCKEYAEKACESNPKLRLVRGYYHCWSWGVQQHWWCEDENGKVVDPTVNQFPSPRIGEYEEYSGYVNCEQCGKEVADEYIKMMGPYPCCSSECCHRLVGL